MITCWLDGALVDERSAVVGIRDRGFTLGDGLFETMRAYAGQVFRLDAHLARLAEGAARIGLPLREGLAAAVRETVAASGIGSAAVRLTVSRGPGEPGILPAEPVRPTTAIMVWPYQPIVEQYQQGARAVLARGRLNEHASTAGLKQLGYLDAVLAQREARAAGASDALLRDTAGHLAEAATSNLFVVRSGTLLTPPLSCGILPGITRAAVLEIAVQQGITTREEALPPEALATASEAFLTSSLREIVPLTHVEDTAVGDGRPGALTLRLWEGYQELTRAETRGWATPT